MQMRSIHRERHRSGRVGWLRAAVLGADDGIVSTASLVLGVAATTASKGAVVVAGVAGLVAGAMSMATGEYVSVSSQRDAERADIVLEERELRSSPGRELNELRDIYVRRGLDVALATTVAQKLTENEPLLSHLRDELGLDPGSLARPIQAAAVSAASFALGAILPVLVLLLSGPSLRGPLIAATALVSLAVLGAIGGRLGGASTLKAAIRVTVGGGLAMLATDVIGRLVGTSVH